MSDYPTAMEIAAMRRRDTRPPAPALTAEEAAIVARFEAAPMPYEVAAEVLRLRAALASPAPAPRMAAMCARCGGDGWTAPEDPRPGVTCDDCNGTGVR